MFHAFDSAGGSLKRTRLENSSRITTTNACSECRRRKVGCDGRTPCKQCLWYKHPDLCSYSKPRQRIAPSHKVLQTLSTSIDLHQTVLKTLFPTKDVKSLAGLSREQLLSLLASPHTINDSLQDARTGVREDGRNLEILEETPSQDVKWDESRRKHEPISHVSDDVNGLSLAVDRQSSYVGVSSIKAALRVILKISPTASKTFLSQTSGGATCMPTPSNNTSSSRGTSPHSAMSAPSALRKEALIDAYFLHVQVLIPLIDEAYFRATVKDMDTKPPDTSWLALFNMVLAIGTIAACKSDETGHTKFYQRAKQFLGTDCFGSGRLEALQALVLMGGYYLHYMNQPNEANAITGAAFRMALAMGLHREISEKATTSNAEVRRKTWWSLFCLDTWASMTLGRPTLRCGPGITIGSSKHFPPANPFHKLHIEDIQFCRIATNVQDRLAISPFVEFNDMAMLDAELVAWYSKLRIPTQAPEPYSLSLLTAHAILKWRFHNLRILLHRPILLSVALRSPLQPPSPSNNALSQDEMVAIAKCRDIAHQSISDIAITWRPNQISGWNAVWFLFQAVMVPLVSIFMEAANPEAEQWRHQIELALELFEKMTEWSLAANRTRDVVARVYAASRVPGLADDAAAASQAQVQMGVGAEEAAVSWDPSAGRGLWDAMMWEGFPDGLDLSLSGMMDFEGYEDGVGDLTVGWMGNGGTGAVS